MEMTRISATRLLSRKGGAEKTHKAKKVATHSVKHLINAILHHSLYMITLKYIMENIDFNLKINS